MRKKKEKIHNKIFTKDIQRNPQKVKNRIPEMSGGKNENNRR